MTFSHHSLLDAVLGVGGNLQTMPTVLPLNKWMRMSPLGKPRHNKSIHLKRLSPSVVFGMNMITGARFVWQENHSCLSAAERQRLYAQAKREQQEALLLQEAGYAKKAKQAAVIWGKALAPDPEHPYCLKKQLKPEGLRQLGSSLVVPVYGIDGQLQSLQFITAGNEKRFLTGGQMRGGFSYAHPYDGESPIVLSEGWATSQSLAQQWDVSGWHVCTFSADNLVTVAKLLRTRFPHAKLIISGDNDVSGKGQASAALAAQSVNASVALPVFSDIERQLSPNCSDWNDRYLLDLTEVNHG
jgi:putative DNA primase/helicase